MIFLEIYIVGFIIFSLTLTLYTLEKEPDAFYLPNAVPMFILLLVFYFITIPAIIYLRIRGTKSC